MNKYRYKKAFRSVSFTIFLLVTCATDAYCFTDNKIVDSSKTWAIHFNQEILIDDLNKESIIVKGSNDTALKCKLTQGEDNRTIIVNLPEEGYRPGESYKLIIGNKTHSANGKNIKKEIVMNFSTQQQESHKVKLADFLQSNTDNIVEYGQYIYYVNKSDSNFICRMKKDNSENVRVCTLGKCNNLTVVGNDIYFTTKSFLYKISNGGLEATKVLDIKNYDKITIYKNSIYYIGKDNFLHTADLNGKEDKVISTDFISDFWIKESCIYYENQQSEHDILWKMDLDGSKKEEFLNAKKDYNKYLDYNNMKFFDGYIYLPRLQNEYSINKNAPIYEKYCNRIKLSNKKQIETVDMEDTFIDYKEDGKSLHNYFYNKLYCVEENEVKEFGANIPKTKILDVDEEYIYFMDYSEYICRVKKDGSSRERILKPQEEIYGDATNHTKAYAEWTDKDYIYYIRDGRKFSENKSYGVTNFCKIKKDGSENIILQQGISTFMPQIPFNHKVLGLEWKSPYYNIIELSEGATTEDDGRILANDSSSSIHLNDGWIYYFSDNTLKRMKVDGSKKETVEVFEDSGLEEKRTLSSYFYGDYLYSVEINDNRQFELWRKDLKNNGKYEYLMPMIAENFGGVDDKFVYLIAGVLMSGGNQCQLYRTNLETHKSDLLYVTQDLNNFEKIGFINGKFYFTRTIHEIKKGY